MIAVKDNAATAPVDDDVVEASISWTMTTNMMMTMQTTAMTADLV